jgi:UTP--glucose-1-phosphate uridylyltransferase
MTNSNKIRKAVIPVAGLGTRFLPITKTIPKEMLPIGDKPLIQYAIEEAAASGIETVILVVGRGKRVLTDYFQRDQALEDLLIRRGRDADAAAVRKLSELVEITTVWQDSPQGLAHAIGCARSQVGDEPFVVILPDALIDAPIPCARQLIDCYARHSGAVIATRRIEPWEVERFGILSVIPLSETSVRGNVFSVLSLQERPQLGTTGPQYGIFGRYVLPAAIFGSIAQVRPGFGGECQLTDALADCSRHVPIFGYCFDGVHYDTGDKLGFLEATLHYALKDNVASQRIRQVFTRPGSPTLVAS